MAEEVIGLLFGVDGGGAIDGRSGQQIVSDLTKIVNQINSGKSTVPKVQLKFDTSHAKKAISELKTQLQEIANMGNISVSGMPTHTGGTGSTANAKQDSANYRNLTATVKQYYAELAKIEKIQMKSTAVSSSGGVWSTTDAQYDALIQKINQLKTRFDSLGVSAKGASIVEMNSAQQLNITEKQRSMLLAQVRSAIIDNGVAHKDSERKISDAWAKNAAKVHEYILRMQDVASKNAEVNALMTELNTLAASGNPQNLDELTAKFTQLQQKVRKTGADVKTWGDRFKKTFGNEVRSVLAATLVGVAAKYLREVYTNVVNLDKALVNLQIASGKTREETRNLIVTYSELGKQLGATTAQVAESADTWLRQGYSTEEANTLIANSMMLSKLGQIESAEAAKYLTSAMKGYNVAVQDSIQIVDKWTAVDMIAAANAGDMATAMSETATSAGIAGVSMDKLIGYIATVKEVTQDGAESVGTFYKTLFARMNNVAAGNFVDDETGESLNDVETVLSKLGIALRDSNGQFRNSGEVLDEVAGRWEHFDNVSQHAIATAFAGTRQQEKFIVLMQNYDSALKYAKTSTEAAGTAQEKYGAYTESVEGKLATLNATFEQLSMTVLHADWIVTGIEMLTGLVSAIEMIASVGDGAVVAILAIAVAIASIVAISTVVTSSIKKLILHHAELAGVQVGATITTKAFTEALKHMGTTGILGVLTIIPRFIAAIVKYIVHAASGTKATITFRAALDSLKINPVMLAITAVVGAMAGAIVAINTYQKELENSAKQTQAAVDATITLDRKLKEEKETLDDLIKSYRELAEANKGVYDVNTQNEFLEIQNKINELVKEHGDSVELVISKYSELGGKMKAIADVQAKQAATSVTETKRSIGIINEAARDDFHRITHSGMSPLATNVEYGNSIDDAISSVENFIANNTNNKAVVADGEGLLSVLTVYKSQIDALTGSLVEFSTVYEDANARGDGILGDDGIITDIDEYAKFKSELVELAKANKDLQDENGNLIVTQDRIVASVERFIQANYGDVFAQLTAETYKANYQLKGFSKIAEEVTKEWDALTEAVSDMESQGALSIDTYQELLNVFPDIEKMKIASDDGKEIDFLEQTASGYYKLNGTIEDYIKLKQEELVAVLASNSEESDAYKNAEEDLKSLIATFNTMSLEQEIETATERLETQLESFEEMIDLRKELLRTYKEELDYQNELQKKQKAVTDIQMKLDVSRLDNSAAGQARTRELEQELQEAQDELDDITLEHAIDVLTLQLDTEKQEYTSMIQQEIDNLRKTVENTNSMAEGVKSIDEQINGLIEQRKKDEEKNKEDERNLAYNNLQDYILAKGYTSASDAANDSEYQSYLNAAVSKGVAGTEAGVEAQMSWAPTKQKEEKKTTPAGYKFISDAKKHGDDPIRNINGNNFQIELGGIVYDLQTKYNSVLGGEQAVNAKTTVENAGGKIQEGSLVTISGEPYVYSRDGVWVGIEKRFWDLNQNNNEYTRFKDVLRQYHTGGFVGGEMSLNHNEEFAKLLKGEFVSTPAQMKRFMERTLPSIANYSSSEGKNEFNAPLIEIVCESVTSESMPKLKQIVDDAVKEIQRQLDSGMSRTGFKRPLQKGLNK